MSPRLARGLIDHSEALRGTLRAVRTLATVAHQRLGRIAKDSADAKDASDMLVNIMATVERALHPDRPCWAGVGAAASASDHEGTACPTCGAKSGAHFGDCPTWDTRAVTTMEGV